MAYTDLFNTGLDSLATTMQTISGLPVVTDPRNILPGCVLIQAPSIDAWSSRVAKMTFPVTVIGSGPGNLDALRALLAINAKLLDKKIGLTSAEPTTANIGGTEQPAYRCLIAIEVQS